MQSSAGAPGSASGASGGGGGKRKPHQGGNGGGGPGGSGAWSHSGQIFLQFVCYVQACAANPTGNQATGLQMFGDRVAYARCHQEFS